METEEARLDTPRSQYPATRNAQEMKWVTVQKETAPGLMVQLA